MVIRHSVKELLAKNSVTRPMKCIIASYCISCCLHAGKRQNLNKCGNLEINVIQITKKVLYMKWNIKIKQQFVLIREAGTETK